jgi:hypothetical protein
MSVPEYKGRKARQAFCHLDPGIRPEFSTLKDFAATFKHLDGFFQPISSPTISRETLRSPLVGAHNAIFSGAISTNNLAASEKDTQPRDLGRE